MLKNTIRQPMWQVVMNKNMGVIIGFFLPKHPGRSQVNTGANGEAGSAEGIKKTQWLRPNCDLNGSNTFHTMDALSSLKAM
jgi:hypothetical protein